MLLLKIGGFEILITVAILFIVIVLPIILGLTIYFAINKNQKANKAWKEFAASSNLVKDRLTIKGIYNSAEIEFSLMKEHSHRVEGVAHVKLYTACICKFQVPLRMQLVIKSTKLNRGLLTDRKFNIGDERFDKAFITECYDKIVAQRLLTTPFPSQNTANLMQDLLNAYSDIGRVMVNDRAVYVEVADTVTDKQVLKNMADIASNLHNRFRAARQVFPLADWEKDLLSSYQDLSNEHGFVVNHKLFSSSGVFNGLPTQIFIDSKKEKLKTIISMRFKNDLQAGFNLITALVISKAITMLGAQDIETGNREFDETFVVKGKDVVYVRQILTPEVCGILLGLKRNTTSLTVNDQGIELEFDRVLTDKNTLKSYMQAIANVGAKIQR